MTKSISTVLFLLILQVNLRSQPNTSPNTSIRFLQTIIDMDTILQGPPGSDTFFYINTGPNPLIITNVKTSCGCLTAKWNRIPLAVGDTGIIVFKLLTYGRINYFRKSITIYGNAGTHSLYIKGYIKED